MKNNIRAVLFASSLALSGCNEKIDDSKTDCLQEQTLNKVSALCEYPLAVKNLDFGNLPTPSDILFTQIDETNFMNVAKIQIAPGHMISVVVRKKSYGEIERIQIFEAGKFVTELVFREHPPFQNNEYIYTDVGVWLDRIYGKNRIGVREFFQILLSNRSLNLDKVTEQAVQRSVEPFQEQSQFSSEQFTSKGEYRTRSSGTKYLHGQGKRNWNITNARGGFRIFYTHENAVGKYSIPGGGNALSIEEVGQFEDGSLYHGTRTLYFDSVSNPYTEMGTFAYTGRMMSANLINGTVRLPNGKQFQVIDGVADIPKAQ